MNSGTGPARAVALPPNPVWRSYTGGRVLRAFRRRSGTDDNHFPEDWLASTVRARNGANAQGPDEGLSRVDDTVQGPLLSDALKEHPGFWWGDREQGRSDAGVLWKLLDSSVRLQLQAHPDAGFARRWLNSNAGKTECWYILATRGEAYVHLGFQYSPGRELWGQLIREQRVPDMLACFEKILVRPGDCYVVPAGTPHAIGEGIFMVELMEPTDWVVRCERVNAGLTLPPEACFMGLDLERCLDIFDYRSYSLDEVRKKFQQAPRVVAKTSSFCEEELIRPAFHSYFRLHRLRGGGDARWLGGELMLLIVVKGAATLRTGAQAQETRAGDIWLLPGAVETWQWTQPSGNWEVLIAKTPVRHAKNIEVSGFERILN